MPRNTDRREGGTAAPPAKIGDACGVHLLRSQHDAFGSRRLKPHYFIVAPEQTANAGTPQDPQDPSALRVMLDAVDCNEVYVTWPRQRASELKAVLLRLNAAGFEVERAWPTLPLLEPIAEESTLFRLTRPMPPRPSRFEASYHAERRRLAPAPEEHALLASLQADIESIARQVVRDTGFDAAYGVLDVMNVGSTSRTTYTAFPADFDIVINTERERTLIEARAAQVVCERIVEGISRSGTFKNFLGAIEEKIMRPQAGCACIALESFGVRGPQSLVARYDLVTAGAAVGKRKVGFLDVSFGKLPQLIGYETWIRRLFAGLGSRAAELLQSEIRLTKSLLKQLGGLYGSSVRGLRAHAVEQWIIQSLNYRASGFSVGTLDNALHLIVEEGHAGERHCDAESGPFQDYKTRFPLRHPGWWETEDTHSDRRLVNLWDLLGDGDMALAQSKWEVFVALASAFESLRAQDEAWDIQSLVRSIK